VLRADVEQVLADFSTTAAYESYELVGFELVDVPGQASVPLVLR